MHIRRVFSPGSAVPVIILSQIGAVAKTCVIKIETAQTNLDGFEIIHLARPAPALNLLQISASSINRTEISFRLRLNSFVRIPWSAD